MLYYPIKVETITIILNTPAPAARLALFLLCFVWKSCRVVAAAHLHYYNTDFGIGFLRDRPSPIASFTFLDNGGALGAQRGGGARTAPPNAHDLTLDVLFG